MFTLAHLSDPHLAPLPAPRWSELIGKRVTGYINWQRRRRFIHQRAVLDRLVADLKAQGPITSRSPATSPISHWKPNSRPAALGSTSSAVRKT